MRGFEFLTEQKQTQKLKHGSTRGHLGEFILGAAVTAKFISGNEPATMQDMKKVMAEAGSSSQLAATFNATRKNVTDVVVFQNIVKNPKNIADIQDTEATLEVMQEEAQAALAFANSDAYAKKLSRLFADNGRPDKIYVKAAGEEDQSSTKADIFLSYENENGEERMLRGMSLKTGSNLVGQASPRTYENMRVFFADLGITLPEMPDYDKDVKGSVEKILQTAKDQLNAMTVGNDENKEADLIQNIYRFLSEHAALQDPKLIIVNLGKGDFSVQKINKMLANLDQVNLETSLKTTGQPAVIVHDKGNIRDQLFQIRYTYSAPRIDSKGKQKPERHRMFVEVGPLFKRLATIKRSEPLD